MPDPRHHGPDEGPPMPAPTWKPPIEEPEADELPDEKRDPNPDEQREPPMSGAPEPAPDSSRSNVANRDPAGPRKAGATPRPTDNPLD